VPTIHTDDLWRRALERWAEIGAISPDLTPAAALQRRLLRLILDGSSRLDLPLPSGLTAPSAKEKWRRGVPALRNEEVPAPEALKDLLPDFCTAIAEGGAGDSALHIRDALLHGDIDAGSLLSVSLARNQKAVRTSALHMGFSPDLVWLVGELGSAPLAHHLQVLLCAGLPPSQNASADHRAFGEAAPVGPEDWDRGYCPFCGSWPVLIESQHGAYALRCSFCALAWTLRSRRCIYCANAGDSFVAAAPDPNRGRRRVDLCGQCGSYTKVIEVAGPTPFPLLAIEDLASMDLDQGAMDRGYRRPELHDLDGVEPIKSSC
jgi:hypothetical protein